MRPYEHGGDIWGNPGITLDFSINTHPLGMPQAAKDAVMEQLDTFWRYPDPQCRELRRALAVRHQLDADNILCGNGAADLIFRICACLKPKNALILAPTFSEYRRPVELFGGQVSEFLLREEKGFALDEGILSSLTPDTDIIFLCIPNNPTGQLIPAALLRQILEACAAQSTLLVVDECFIEFTRGSSLTALCRQYPRLLILRAFTKFYGLAGLRLGYLIGRPELLARVAPFGAHWSVSSAAQAAGLGALDETGWAEMTLNLIEGERSWLSGALSGLGLKVFPSDANFLLCKSSLPLYDALKKKSILVRGCANFTGLDERFIRVGIKTRAQNTALVRAVGEVLHG